MAASEEIVELARGAALKAAEIKPTSITAIDVSERLILTEVFLVISAGSQPQMRGLVDAVDRAMHEAGEKLRRREGFEAEMHWVLLDYGDLIVHIQLDEDREFYALEKLWGDCPQIDLAVDLRADSVSEGNHDEVPSTLDRLLAGSDAGEDFEAGSDQ